MCPAQFSSFLGDHPHRRQQLLGRLYHYQPPCQRKRDHSRDHRRHPRSHVKKETPVILDCERNTHILLMVERRMKKILLLCLILLMVPGCSAPRTSVAKVVASVSPTEVTQRASGPTVTNRTTRTPWPTIVIPDTPLPPPTVTPAPFRPSPTPIPSATPILPTPTPPLAVICYFGGTSLVPVANYLGRPEYYAEFSIGGWQCNLPANTKGYLQIEPGTYGWSAGIPARGRFGKVQGTITVGLGVNIAEIVLCAPEDRLATAPQCPSVGAAPPTGASNSIPTVVPSTPTRAPK